MRKRRIAALAASAALVLGACEGAGEHNNADSADGQGAPGTLLDSAAQGTNVQAVPPPVGTVNPSVSPDSNTSPTTPGTVDSSGAPQQPPADSLGRQPG
jgi:hypothetical protein